MKNIVALFLFICSCVSTSFHDEIKLDKDFEPIKKMIVVVDLVIWKNVVYWEKKLAKQLRNKMLNLKLAISF